MNRTLHTGFRLHAQRHEVIGDTIRLHTNTGTVDVPAACVAGFVVEEYVPPKPEVQL